MIMYITIICVLIFLLIRMKVLNDKETSKTAQYYQDQIKLQRAEAIMQSKAVTRGQVTEHMLPLFPGFPYTMSDVKFSAQPIDYLVFEGMSTFRDGKEAEISIILADVKVGSAQRTKVQNAIKKAVEEGRVRFETWTVDKDNKIKIK